MELVPATAEAGWSVFLFEEPKTAVYAIPDNYVSEAGDKAYWPPQKDLTKCYAIMRKNSRPNLDWPTYKGKLIKKGKTGDEAHQNAKKCRETLILKNQITASDCETTDLDGKRKGKTRKIYSPSVKSKKKKKIVPLPEPPTTESVGKEKPYSLSCSSDKTSGMPDVLNDKSRSKEINQPLSTSKKNEDSSSSWRANLQKSLLLLPETPPTPNSPTLTNDSPTSIGVIEATPPKNSPVKSRNLSPVKRDLTKELEDYFSKKLQYEAGLTVAKEKADEDQMPKTLSSSQKMMRNTDQEIMQTLKGMTFPMDTTTFQKYIVTSMIHIKNQLLSLQAAPALEASLENAVFQMGNLDFPLRDVEELKVFMTTLMTDVSFFKKLKAFLVKRIRKLKHEFAPSLAAENILRKGTLPWLFSTNLVATTNITTIKTFAGSDHFFQLLYDVLSESGIGISRKEKVMSLCGLHFRRIGSRYRDKEKKNSGAKKSADAGQWESLATKKALVAKRGLMSSPIKGLRMLGLMRMSPSKQANAKSSSRKLTPGYNASPKPLLSPNKRKFDSRKKKSISTANISEDETGIESQNQESDCNITPHRERKRQRAVTKKIGSFILSSDEEIPRSKKSRRTTRESSSDESIQESQESVGDGDSEV